MKARKMLVSTMAIIAGCTFALGFSGCEYTSNIVNFKDKRFVKSEGFTFEWVGNDAYGVIGFDASRTSVCVPSSVKGYAVTAIEDAAFKNQLNIITVELPDSIESIGEYAFYHCTRMYSIFVPEEVEKIGKYAFCDCENLTIYCEAESEPEGWHDDWNAGNCPVVWGYSETV